MHEPPATSSLVISASPLPLPLLFSRFKKLLLFSSSLLLLLQKPLPTHSATLKELCPFHRACQALITFIPAVNHTALFRVNLGGIIYVKNKAEKSTSKFPCRHLFFFFFWFMYTGLFIYQLRWFCKVLFILLSSFMSKQKLSFPLLQKKDQVKNYGMSKPLHPNKGSEVLHFYFQNIKCCDLLEISYSEVITKLVIFFNSSDDKK